MRFVAAMLVVAVTIACRGGEHRGAGSGSGAHASLVPKLPRSEDGAAELRAIDQRIRIHAAEPAQEISLLLERAAIRGDVEDYVDALARSEAFVKAAPKDPVAW